MWGVIMLAVVALVLLITGAVFIFYRSLMVCDCMARGTLGDEVQGCIRVGALC